MIQNVDLDIISKYSDNDGEEFFVYDMDGELRACHEIKDVIDELNDIITYDMKISDFLLWRFLLW